MVRAGRIWGAAERLRKDIGAPIPGDRRGAYQQAVDAARIELGGKALDRAWREGSVMKMEEAIRYALGAEAEDAEEQSEQRVPLRPTED